MKKKLKLSVLDLSPVVQEKSPSNALQESLELAKFVDELGYYRYWFAEHHGMEGIATTSPEIMIAMVAQATSRLRVGSGGVMLPNHSPLKVAENFRTLEALFPGRIDLGLGRAPGTDLKTALALRRHESRIKADYFTEELEELRSYLDQGYQDIKAMPETKGQPDIWLLGSSDFSARLSAKLGLPFSFADHFSNLPAKPILDLYRDSFISHQGSKPHTMLGAHIICANTDEEARRLALSSDYSFYRLRMYGKSEPLLSPLEVEHLLGPSEKEKIRALGMKKFVGSPATIKEKILAFQEEAQFDELIITSFIHDFQARLNSYDLLHKCFQV